MDSATGRLFEVTHNLLVHKLTLMRGATSTDKFRRLMHEVSLVLGVEATRDLPVGKKKPVVVTILRGGLGMSGAMLELMPAVRAGHIGLHREGNKLIEFLISLPDMQGRPCIVLDPVIGTGNVAYRAIEILTEKGVEEENIKFITIRAAPEGLSLITDRFRRASVFFAEMASGLNENLHVISGWEGDAGNRLFGIRPEEAHNAR